LNTAVGNSPHFWSESPGAWQHYHPFDANVVIVQKTRQSFRPRHVVLAIVEFSEQQQQHCIKKNDNVAQAF
jgi:hypothetical protein